MPDFLLEIGLEEIPARMVDSAREELARRVGDLLVRERLVLPRDPKHPKVVVSTREPVADLEQIAAAATGPDIQAFSTPRRIAVLASRVATAQPDAQEQLTGPSLRVAYKDGQPTPAAEAFAKKAGVDVSKLEKISNPKGEYLAATVSKRGKAAVEVLAEMLPREMSAIYWAKNMYWRAGKPERFVRPVRWIVAEFDGTIVSFSFGGTHTGDTSRGHRILAPLPVKITKPTTYKECLAKAGVIVEPAERRRLIENFLDSAVKAIPGARWRKDDALLATVVNLTESPSLVLGNFDKEYLSLPEEILVTVMRDHQKYFAVEDANGKLLPHFLAVLNTNGDPDGLIRHGNERVLRARFNDARFFWKIDQKIPLAARVEMLKSVTFQKDLGSYYEKARRMAHLASIGGADFDKPGRKIHRNELYESAWLAKADLTTELVKEFTELQGVVGGLYAKAQGINPVVADAIYDHYKPESMDENVPRSIEGAILSIADKADSIAGMFALGLQPTGSKDPFALRRQANGIVKIIAEHQLPLDLRMLFNAALAAYKGSEAEKRFTNLDRYTESLAAFFRERLEFYLRDVKGYAYDEVNAVLAANSIHVLDAIQRVAAVSVARKSPDFESISIAFKRIKNILRQAGEKNIPVPGFDPKLLREDPEKALAQLGVDLGIKVEDLRKHHKYSEALAEIAKLRPALDAFFDKVMVMVEDDRLRGNRLALLNMLLKDFSTIADFSEIVTEKKP
jgi:glycyl-tRNA synthetase beta chain